MVLPKFLSTATHFINVIGCTVAVKDFCMLWAVSLRFFFKAFKIENLFTDVIESDDILKVFLEPSGGIDMNIQR